ncbi:hypothetical protein QMK51_11325 [Pseudomonas sp. P9_31]|nr:hypothetical protein [Pseudomonas sp. P9_31]WPN60845.1 hypothetical protein QMK51_11325 [Pseudomonas sp. P9_31]
MRIRRPNCRRVTTLANLAGERLNSVTLRIGGVENLQSTLQACSDLEQQAARLKQLVGSFRI